MLSYGRGVRPRGCGRVGGVAPAAPEAAEAPQRAPRQKQETGVVSEVLGSTAVKGFLRSAAAAAGREITRSIFGTARRRH